MGVSGSRVSSSTYIFSVSLLLLVLTVRSISLFSVPPSDFVKGDLLQIKVNKLSSTKTLLPYDYHYLKYCKIQNITSSEESLVELLQGDRIKNSVYNFHMREEQPCKVACRVMLDTESLEKFKEKIDDEYRVNMILDNLPVAVRRQRLRSDWSRSTTYERGFQVGFKLISLDGKLEEYYVNNHLSFRVLYHKNLETHNSARIVGFEVTPSSVIHEYEEWDEKDAQLVRCNHNSNTLIGDTIVPQVLEKDREVVFTYDVSFEESDIRWASRWDPYFLKNNYEDQWIFIMKNLMVLILLLVFIAMIMSRNFRREVFKYNNLRIEECQEESGWELIHGDVFRVPANSGLLCVYVGSGVQILAMTLVTMIFALLGFLSPSNQGCYTIAMVVLWIFMCLFAGYSSARLYKMFKGTRLKRITLKTAFMFPGILFAILFIRNALIWGEKSSGAVPFGTMFAFVSLWFGASVPLVFLGSYLGFRKPATENPVKTNKIPRQIPQQPWYVRRIFMVLIGGIIPYGCISIELFYIMTTIWLNQFEYKIGVLCTVFVIFVVACMEITVLLCYYQLCSEDYNWWWRAYMTAGSPALYVFLYSIFYFFTKLRITKLVSIILYFGYMSVASFALFLLTGTLGFYAFLWFVWKSYSALKKD